MARRSKDVISYTMARIKSKGTSIEILLSLAMRNAGLIGYRKHANDVFGKPDFVWEKQKIAIFCDSVFWHGYKKMATKKHYFKRRKVYWTEKIARNIIRDKEVNKRLRRDGWVVIRFWDFQILKDSNKCVTKILNVFKTNNRKYQEI